MGEIVPQKLCVKCNRTKESSQFEEVPSSADGLHIWCKSCIRRLYQRKYVPATYMKSARSKRRVIKSSLVLQKQGAEIKQIVAHLIENPFLKYADIANLMGIKEDRIKNLMKNNDYLKALRFIASGKMTEFIPLAINGMKDSLVSENADVKFKSSVKLLENESVMGPQKIDLTVNNIRTRPIEELQKLIQDSKSIPAQTFTDVEFVQ